MSFRPRLAPSFGIVQTPSDVIYSLKLPTFSPSSASSSNILKNRRFFERGCLLERPWRTKSTHVIKADKGFTDDSDSATGSATGFMDLPVELRLRIYGYVSATAYKRCSDAIVTPYEEHCCSKDDDDDPIPNDMRLYIVRASMNGFLIDGALPLKS